MIRLLLLLYLLSNYYLLDAQAEVYTIPFQKRGSLIILKAKIDGQTGYFILDTGIGPLVLNSRYFSGSPSSKYIIGVDGRRLPVEERRVNLQVGEWQLPHTHADITDLRALEVYTGLPINGNIGGSLFKNCELVIDYIFNELTIYPKRKNTRRRPLHTSEEAQLSFKYKGSIPSFEVKVGEKSLRFGLDTGASSNVLNRRRHKEVAEHFIPKETLELATFGNTTATTVVGQIKELSIGGQACSPMPTLLASLDGINKQLMGPRLDGLLGYPFLSQFRVAIDFGRREVRLWSPQTVREQYLASQNERDGNNR